MKKAGDILREERMAQNLSIESVSSQTRIRKEYIHAIELGLYDVLPNELYTRGFIRNYAIFLKLDPDKVLPFYRREARTEEVDKKVINKPEKALTKIRFYVTPSRILITLLATVFTVFIVALFVQYRNYAGVPVLLLDSPPDNLITVQKTIQIVGKTDPGTTVTINGQKTEILLNGDFETIFELNDGINRLRIVAESRLGKTKVIERVVEKRIE